MKPKTYESLGIFCAVQLTQYSLKQEISIRIIYNASRTSAIKSPISEKETPVLIAE